MTDPSALLVFLPLCLIGLFALVFAAVLALSVKIVPESKRLSVFRFGKFIGEKGPGIVVLMPFIDSALPSEPGKPIRTR